MIRPEPGLARGRWEAPAWVFWVMLAVVIAFGTAYLLRRLGLLRIGQTKKPESSHPSLGKVRSPK